MKTILKPWLDPADQPPQQRQAGLPYGLHPLIDTLITVGDLCELQLKTAELMDTLARGQRRLALAICVQALAIVLLSVGFIIKGLF